MRNLFRATTSIVVGTLTLAGGASTAFAANDSVYYYYGGKLSGETKHIDSGDVFRVYDHTGSDNDGMYGALYQNDWLVDEAYNGRGAGTYVTFQFDIKKGVSYLMAICQTNGDPRNDPDRIRDCRWETVSE